MSKKISGYADVLTSLEIKDRVFLLKANKSPLRYMIPVKHSSRRPLTYFDGQMNRALRWASNQTSPFVDQQDGMCVVEPIVFENGKLLTQANQINLQKFLFLHPFFENVFYEFDPNKEAQESLSKMNLELDAQLAVKDMDIDELESVARVALKGKADVSSLTSSELRRDMLIWSKSNPAEFLSLLNDENIRLRNVAVKAVEMKILHIKDDNRTVVWEKDKRQKVHVVPFGENVYAGLAEFFKTDEGLDVLQKITNEL
jgi:hypothetical protein